MDFTGRYVIPAPTETVWAALNDPEILKYCIPGCEQLEKTSPTDFSAVAMLKSNMVLGLETSSSRMASLARQQMYFGRFFSLDDLVTQIEQVTPDDIQSLARTLFRPESIALTLLGNLGTMKLTRADLAC